MKRILVTTDLSPEAAVAFQVAKKFASAFKAEVTLLTVVEDPQQAAMIYAMEFPVFPDSNVHKQLLAKVETELKNLAATTFKEEDARYVVREAKGPVHMEIIDYAKEYGADLIVIATHGRTGVTHMIIGSVAERVAREAPCPAVVVPTKTMLKNDR